MDAQKLPDPATLDGVASDARRERILFVCTANRDRSPTAEDLYANDARYEVRSAGTWPHAVTPITRELLTWADRVFVLCEREDRHASQIKERFPDLSPRVVDLDLPDRREWCRSHPELVNALLERLEPLLGRPEGFERADEVLPPPKRPGCGTVEIRGVRRLFAVGDVQSNYEPFALLLEAAGLLEWTGDEPRWSGGDATLLLMGDLLDGGTRPSDVLWLVTTLAAQAPAAGGRLLLLKGNHEHMLLSALLETTPFHVMQWFSNGGLETLVRLAHARGHSASSTLQAAIFTPTFGVIDTQSTEIVELLQSVREDYAPELGFVAREARAAALVNGCLLAAHGAPNLEAADWPSFAVSEADDLRIAWRRDWLDGFRLGGENLRLTESMRGLKSRLDDPGRAIAIRHVLFAHTPLTDLSITGLRGRQARIGRILSPRDDLPALYDVITVPREMAPGGALGGLDFSRDGIVAIYSAEINDGTRYWPARETLGEADPAFGAA